MKLHHLTISNFLGARDVQIDTAAPVTLVCGPNGSGKSSVRDALDLALTGALHRVALKKDCAALVTEGAQKARISVAGQDLAVDVAISAAGKLARSGASVDALPALLPYVLDGQRFARGLTADGRRQFLFGLMGVQVGVSSIKAKLAARGCDQRLVAKIMPTEHAAKVLPALSGGLEAAHAESKRHAAESRGAWKAVTGEAYGSQKAADWRAPVPGQAVDGEPTDPALLKACDAALESWQRSMGAATAERERRAGLQRRMPDLQAAADLQARRRTKLAADEAELADVQAQLQRAREAAGAAPRVGLVHDLAASLSAMLGALFGGDGLFGNAPEFNTARAALARYEAEHGKLGATGGDPEARAKLPALQQAAALCERTVANSLRDVEAAQRAAAELANITAELAQPMEDTSEAEAQIAKLKAERAAIVARLDAAASAKRAHEAALRKTTEAAGHHADVQAWEQIAEALAHSGIPAELLSEALTPLNDVLRGHAESAQWPCVAVEADMTVTADGRAYALLSESEQWRADAMLAAAIAQLSDVRLLVLDRFDVLDGQGRSDALYWLDDLSAAGDIDTAIIFGTLARAPSGLPDTVRAVWIEGGRASAVAAQGQREEVAA